jgi:hypothetical protein
MGLSTEWRLNESFQEFQVAVLATEDGRFTFQIFTVCGEPQTLRTDSQLYTTQADAVRAGHEAIVSMRNGAVLRALAFRARQ